VKKLIQAVEGLCLRSPNQELMGPGGSCKIMAQKPIPAVDVLNNKSYFKSLELFVVPEV
jgi:hypothetical protein